MNTVYGLIRSNIYPRQWLLGSTLVRLIVIRDIYYPDNQPIEVGPYRIACSRRPSFSGRRHQTHQPWLPTRPPKRPKGVCPFMQTYWETPQILQGPFLGRQSSSNRVLNPSRKLRTQLPKSNKSTLVTIVKLLDHWKSSCLTSSSLDSFSPFPTHKKTAARVAKG